MALDDYDGLKASLTDWLIRPELTSQLDDFIDIAEARHRREIRFRDMLVREPITIDARLIDLPTAPADRTFLEAAYLRILTDEAGNDVPVFRVNQVGWDVMTDRMEPSATERPEYFTVHDKIEFNVTPDQTYGGEILYYASLTGLDNTNTMNALLTQAPDVYLWACLLAAAPFLMNDERIPVWVELYKDASEAFNRRARRSMNAGPIDVQLGGIVP